MSSAFSQDEIASLKGSFDHFDRDGNGSINKSELRPLLRMVGEKHNPAAIASSMQEFDTNQDDVIDFEEFLILASKVLKHRVP
ncbi:hypothetical protein BGZ72_000195 [Mortierella alpina]|nr:hypothetical protein BGZ72_000195 [Mortierella alpina]